MTGKETQIKGIINHLKEGGEIGRMPNSSVEIIIEALEKQVAKEPIKANRIIVKDGAFFLNDDNEYWKCPMCTKYDVPLLERQEYCHCCGQALDWSVTK